MSNTKSKNNIFYYSPGGYGPHEKPQLWADHIEPENNEEDNDEWHEAACDSVDEQNVDYGCYFMSRKEAEELLETLKKLLEE